MSMPSYYGIVERFARNQLLENQFIKTESVVPQCGSLLGKRVARVVHGSWASYSKPNSLDNCLKGTEGCCVGAGIRGCFLVWEHAITKDAGKVMVNMAFSRNSPWVEVISHRPYAGRLDITVHDAPDLLVRIPEWVSENDLRVLVDKQSVPATPLRDGYFRFSGLQEGASIRVEYPIGTESRAAEVNGREYNTRWKGDTVVGIRPRGEHYPLYEREALMSRRAYLAGWSYGDQKGGPIHR
jgi:hypothetical protein